MIDNANAGAAAAAAKAIKDGYVDAYTAARKQDKEFWAQSEKNAIDFRNYKKYSGEASITFDK